MKRWFRAGVGSSAGTPAAQAASGQVLICSLGEARRKIRLDLDHLDVESFDVTGDAAARGTLVGHEATENTWCNQESCGGTCLTDCWGACGGGGTGGCQIHANTCTQGERCYSRPDTYCAPTDYLTRDPC